MSHKARRRGLAEIFDRHGARVKLLETSGAYSSSQVIEVLDSQSVAAADRSPFHITVSIAV
jgi:hypothetical protein